MLRGASAALVSVAMGAMAANALGAQVLPIGTCTKYVHTIQVPVFDPGQEHCIDQFQVVTVECDGGLIHTEISDTERNCS